MERIFCRALRTASNFPYDTFIFRKKFLIFVFR